MNPLDPQLPRVLIQGLRRLHASFQFSHLGILNQQFSTGMPQECLKHALPGSSVRGADLLSLSLSNKKMTAASWCE